jgi:nucleotide-binding universal stress UspA family protein
MFTRKPYRTGLKRFMLGSVSMKVLSGVHCSVRLARKHDTKAFPLKILVGYDASIDAEKVIDKIENRQFSRDSHIHIVSVVEMFYMTTLPYAAVAVEESLIRSLNEREQVLKEKLDVVQKRLMIKYPNTTTELIRGNPKRALIDAADKLKADEIFVGARGMTNLERVFLGSVSHYIAGHSHCTVEIVR